LSDALNLVPMQNQHDTMQRIDSRCLRAEVVDLPSGFKAIEADFDVDSEAWAAVQAGWEAAGVSGGMSFSCTESLRSVPEAELELAADAYYFEDDDIIMAADIMSVAGSANAQRLYQFAAVPPPHIIIELTVALASIPISVLGAAIYDGLKFLLLKRLHRDEDPEGETQIDLCIRGDAHGSFGQTVHIRSSNEEVLKHAIDRIGEAIESPSCLLVWNEECTDWEVPERFLRREESYGDE
jgi:hypothetical protein